MSVCITESLVPNLAVELYFLKRNKYTMIRILQDKISAS